MLHLVSYLVSCASLLLLASTIHAFPQTLDPGVDISPVPSLNGSLTKTSYPNCYGSSMCKLLMHGINSGPVNGEIASVMPILPLYEIGAKILPQMRQNATFRVGEQIACVAYKWRHLPWDAHICLFLQGDRVPPQGLTVRQIRYFALEMYRFGCKACGSVDLYGRGRETEDSRAMLTANYVSKAKCKGGCEPGGGENGDGGGSSGAGGSW